MSEKKSATCCLMIALSGWAIGFAASYIFMGDQYAGFSGSTSAAGYYMFCNTVAAGIHLLGIALGINHLAKKMKYANICLAGMALSLFYLISYVILWTS